MATILNEVKQAEYIIERGEVGSKPTSTLFLLAKYYRQKQELSKEHTIQKLNEFMQKNYKNYISARWEDIIEDIVKKATKYPLRMIDAIGITQNEIDKIKSLSNVKYEKLLFAMLCYAKLHNMNSDTNNGWVNATIQEIYRTARVTVKYKRDKFLYLNDIEQTGLIAFSKKNDNLNLQITFIDMTGNPIWSINDFRELGYEYLNIIGEGRFIRCNKCGRLVRKKSKKDFSTKYCSFCSKYIKNEQNKMYYKNKF